MVSIYIDLEGKAVNHPTSVIVRTKDEATEALSLPRYLPAGLTYLNNLFSKNSVKAYDSFLNVSIRCREQLTTNGHDLRRLRQILPQFACTVAPRGIARR